MISLKVNKEISRKKTKFARKRAKLKKHVCYPPAIKNSAKELNKEYKQYTSCTCEPVCGDQCPCLTSGNVCEKYCGYVSLILHIHSPKLIAHSFFHYIILILTTLCDVEFSGRKT